MAEFDSVFANASAYSPRPNLSSHSQMSRAMSASFGSETVPILKGFRGSHHRRHKPHELRLWVNKRPRWASSATSAVRGRAEGIGQKADIGGPSPRSKANALHESTTEGVIFSGNFRDRQQTTRASANFSQGMVVPNLIVTSSGIVERAGGLDEMPRFGPGWYGSIFCT